MRFWRWGLTVVLMAGLAASARAVDRISGVQIVPRNDGVTQPADAPMIPGATVVGNEIRLPKGGVNVELEFIASGWGEVGDELGAIQATVDSSGYLGLNANPASNPDLIPLGFPADPLRGAFQAVLVCNISHRDCGPGMSPCGPFEGVCTRNPRFIFYPVASSPHLLLNTATLNYWWGSVTNPASACLPDPGPGPDPFDYGYLGTLILQVPLGAVGTYELPLIDHPDFTFWTDCDAFAIDLPQLVSARITILDCDQDGTSDGREIDLGLSTDCNANFIPDSCEIAGGQVPDCNSNAVPDSCDPDSDGDGSIDACEACPNDPLKTTPGVCGCGSPDVDLDMNGEIDACDLCPNDPLKTTPGACGCGTPDEDLNGNGTPDCFDGIPAASTWGLMALALSLLVAAKIVFGGRRSFRQVG